MGFATFVIKTVLAIDVILIGYGQAQRYEGSPCQLYDASRGTCKNVAFCESIKVGLRTGTLGYNNIVGCSFQGAIQIVCCADERPTPGRNRPTPPSPPNSDFIFFNRPNHRPWWPHRPEHHPNRFVNVPSMLPSAWNTATNVLTNNGLVFPSDPRQTTTTTTTAKPTRSTTANSFWQEWALPTQPAHPTRATTRATRPTKANNGGDGSNSNGNTVQTTTPEMADWMKEVISEYSTTTTEASMLPWMQEVLNEYSTTPKSNNHQTIQTTTLKPTKTTTVNSFWNEWSVLNPTNVENDNSPNGSNSNQGMSEKLRQTTTEIPGWMKEVLNEQSSTPSVNNGNNNAIKPTTARVQTTTNNMPSWMRDVLNEHSTTPKITTTSRSTFVTSTTKKSSIGDGNLFTGGGSIGGGGGDLQVSTPNSNENDSSSIDSTTSGRVTTKKPTTSIDGDTKTRYSKGSKAEAACDIYSRIQPAISWNILGGVPTNLGEFPWMAALGYRDINNDISYDCGGTLISDYFVLTAAHCAPSRRQPQVVRMGKVTLLTNDDDAEPVDVNIQEIIRHPQYNSLTKKNDIALVRLAQRVEFTANVRPACLRTELADVLPGNELIITGWGTTSAERTLRPSILLKTNVTSMPLELCNTTLVNINRQANEPGLRNGLSSSQFCAFDPAARNDACQGDSGGPLQAFPDTENIASIIGVVSFGVSCGTKLPSVYTRVAYYLDWIEPTVWPNL